VGLFDGQKTARARGVADRRGCGGIRLKRGQRGEGRH